MAVGSEISAMGAVRLRGAEPCIDLPQFQRARRRSRDVVLHEPDKRLLILDPEAFVVTALEADGRGRFAAESRRPHTEPEKAPGSTST